MKELLEIHIEIKSLKFQNLFENDTNRFIKKPGQKFERAAEMIGWRKKLSI